MDLDGRRHLSHFSLLACNDEARIALNIYSEPQKGGTWI